MHRCRSIRRRRNRSGISWRRCLTTNRRQVRFALRWAALRKTCRLHATCRNRLWRLLRPARALRQSLESPLSKRQLRQLRLSRRQRQLHLSRRQRQLHLSRQLSSLLSLKSPLMESPLSSRQTPLAVVRLLLKSQLSKRQLRQLRLSRRQRQLHLSRQLLSLLSLKSP